jgi:type II secretory pathway predicted ATPase ExeA
MTRPPRTYTSYYGLTAEPFGAEPDPRFFFEGPGQKRALAYLRYGITRAEGAIVITGTRGIGKTMLVRRLARQLRARTLHPVQLTVPPSADAGLTTAVAGQLGLAPGGASTSRLRAALKGHLVTLRQAGRRALLVLDDAHRLDEEGLDELQALLALRAGSASLLPALLFADAELREVLRAPNRAPLRQATVAAYQLNPFGLEETVAYVEHRLRLAGWREDPVFLPLAYMEVFMLSMGIPGRINQLCYYALEDAAEQGLREIKVETVSTASTRVPADPGEADRRPW